MKINDFCDNAYCINLPERTEKKERCIEVFNSINLSVEFFNAIDGNTIFDKSKPLRAGYQGLAKSLMNIIDDARKNKYKSILIFEDDVEFVKNAGKIFEENICFLPDNWDIFYLGCVNTRYGTRKIEGLVHKIRYALLGHAFAIKETVYDLWYSELEKMEKINDVALAKLSYAGCIGENDLKSYAFMKKGIAFQRKSFSDNVGKLIDNSYID